MTMTETIKIGDHPAALALPSRILAALRRIFWGFRMYQRPLGAKGVLAYCSYRVFGSPKTIVVKATQIPNPVTLRIRTTDVSGYDQILLRGHYGLPLPFVPKTIVDLGANIGMASLYYAHAYPEARIVAVEAEASNFEVLLRNVRPYPTILPIHAAIWNRDGEVAMTTPPEADGGIDKTIFTAHEGEGTRVRAITMRTLMEDAHISSIDLLKVDIEGAEKEVFETAREWIQNVRCIAIELHDRFKPGCRPAVSAVTEDFLESEKGETTIYLRKSCPGPSEGDLQAGQPGSQLRRMV
jgi:FkbM family methyltransferase